MARGDYFRNMTPEQRKAFDLARLAKMKTVRSESSSYTVSPDTDRLWAELAVNRGIRLAHSSTPLSAGRLTTFLHKLNIPVGKFSMWSGLKVSQYVQENSTFSLRAVMGLTLEHLDVIQSM